MLKEKLHQVLDTLYEEVVKKPNEVLNIFNNFFGEERVDMQEFSKEDILQCIFEIPISDFFYLAESHLPTEISKDATLRDIDPLLLSGESIIALSEVLLVKHVIRYILARISGFILVHFPRTVVTNEYDKSTIVKDIYIKVPISAYGTEDGVFTMNRSNYTIAEIYSNYMHSHANYIPTNDFRQFVHCCIGEGPLKDTQLDLSIEFNEDLWNLFCLELSKYVEVESVGGCPYHYLEHISYSTTEPICLDYPVMNTLSFSRSPSFLTCKGTIAEFFRYYLDNNDLIFSFRNGEYSLGMPYIEYLIHISNSFIEWINCRPYLKHLRDAINLAIMGNYIVKDNKIYMSSSDIRSRIEKYRSYVGRLVCTFKGRPITVVISDINKLRAETVNAKLIKPSIASWLLYRILITINYRYGRNQKDPNTYDGKVEYKI